MSPRASVASTSTAISSSTGKDSLGAFDGDAVPRDRSSPLEDVPTGESVRLSLAWCPFSLWAGCEVVVELVMSLACISAQLRTSYESQPSFLVRV